MSAPAEAIASPFRSVSLSELRSLTSARRDAEAQNFAERRSVGQVWSLADPSFDEVLSGDGDDADATPSVFPLEAMQLDYTRQEGRWRLGRNPMLAIITAVLPGAFIFLGLLWTTAAVTVRPEWVPEQLWFGDWFTQLWG